MDSSSVKCMPYHSGAGRARHCHAQHTESHRPRNPKRRLTPSRAMQQRIQNGAAVHTARHSRPRRPSLGECPSAEEFLAHTYSCLWFDPRLSVFSRLQLRHQRLHPLGRRDHWRPRSLADGALGAAERPCASRSPSLPEGLPPASASAGSGGAGCGDRGSPALESACCAACAADAHRCTSAYASICSACASSWKCSSWSCSWPDTH